MKWLIFDCETTTHMKGNPFSKYNRAVVFGFKSDSIGTVLIWEDESNVVERIQKIIDDHDIIVGANIKFDIHWLIRYGIKFNNNKLWDVLIYRYRELYQAKRFISLNDCCEAYGIPTKLDVVKEVYWKNGIDTDAIPRDILGEYLVRDLDCTGAVLDVQRKVRPSWFTCFRLDCVDLWSLIEMEQNGAPVNVKGVLNELEVQKGRRVELYMEIMDAISPDYDINLGSSDELSVALFGGVIYEKYKLPIGEYKSGAKIGQTRYKWFVNEHAYEGQYTPVEGSEVDKVAKDEEGNTIFKYYSTSEDNLKKVKCTKKRRKVLDNIIEVGKVDKLIQSYLNKIPAMIEEYGWEHDTLHPNFNSTITITGRLSSDKPNFQNLHPTFQKYVETRYK